MESISPTIERLRHARSYDAPERNQNVNRIAYKVNTPFEAMERRGDITPSQLLAAQKLTKHYMGAMGVYVGSGNGAPDPDAEFPQVYHGQMCAAAAKQLLSHEYRGLVHLIEESADLEAIGRQWLGCKDKAQARMAGKALTITGLERLAVHWRLKSREP